jgi:hypothetical protein
MRPPRRLAAEHLPPGEIARHEPLWAAAGGTEMLPITMTMNLLRAGVPRRAGRQMT